MAYEKIPEDSTPLSVINEAFKRESSYLPALSLIVINQLGAVALVETEDGTSLRFPEGKIYRPKKSLNETALDKVEDTACARVNGVLGPLVDVDVDSIALAPYASRNTIALSYEDQDRWPMAIGKITIPSIVPTIVKGADPERRFRVMWAGPEEALAIMRARIKNSGSTRTKLTLEALQVSMPTLTQTLLARSH